jgi:hypothetical protein
MGLDPGRVCVVQESASLRQANEFAIKRWVTEVSARAFDTYLKSFLAEAGTYPNDAHVLEAARQLSQHVSLSTFVLITQNGEEIEVPEVSVDVAQGSGQIPGVTDDSEFCLLVLQRNSHGFQNILRSQSLLLV